MPLLATSGMIRATHSPSLFAPLYKCFVSALFLLISAPSIANESDLSEANQLLDLNSTVKSWLPGERYDAQFGTVNYAKTDFYFEGNGNLPIEIRRVFYQRPESTSRKISVSNPPTDSFGMMGLAIPQVVMLINQSQAFQACDGLPGQGFWVNEPAMRFMNGDQKITFFSTDGKTSNRLSSSGIDADFMSQDNWAVKCQFNSADGDKLGPLTLDVHSPNGITYRMRGKKATGSEDTTQIVYYVKTVTDSYGNTLDYNYTLYTNPAQTKLTSIESDDGRKVTLAYEKVREGGNTYRRIITATGNGAPNRRFVRYTYPRDTTPNRIYNLNVSENGKSAHRYQFESGKLQSIVYPTGGGVRYNYDGNALRYAGKFDYKPLFERILMPASGGFNSGVDVRMTFSRHRISDGSYARVIKTPSGALEYGFNTLPTLEDYKPENYDPDDGKLAYYKVYDGRFTNWTTRKEKWVLLNRIYDYKSVYKISDFAHKDGDRIVLAKVTSKMNPNYLNNYVTNISTEYKEHDYRGYPKEIIEKTGESDSSKSRTTTLTYKHSGFETWMVGKPLTVDIDSGLDTTVNRYNTQGDIDQVTKNGKILSNFGYYIEGPSTGELASHTHGKNDNSLPRGITSYKKYYRGKARDIIDPKARKRTLVVNSDGTIKSQTRPGDTKITEYTYDSARRIDNIDPARAASNERNFDYSPNQRETTEERRGGLGFDEYGRLEIDARYDEKQRKWSTIEYVYDVEGRLVFQSYPQNRSIDQARVNQDTIGIASKYDALGRLKETTSSASDENGNYSTNTTSIAYQASADGNQEVSVINELGHERKTEFLAYGTPHLNWPITITEADNTEATIDRNSIGNVRGHVQGGKGTYTQYNDQNLVRRLRRGDDSVTLFTYYNDGSLRTRYNNDRIIRYYYHSDGRLRQEDFVDGTGSVQREFYYDRNGNLELLFSQTSEGDQTRTLYKYDAEDNLKTETLLVDGQNMELTYTYDGWSNRSSIEYPNGDVYDFDPDAFGNPTSIIQSNNEFKRMFDAIEYHPNGSPRLLRREGHQIRMDLDAAQRPKDYKLNLYYRGTNKRLAEKSYYYDGANNVSRINDSVNRRYVEFVYDRQDRLTDSYVTWAGRNSDNWKFTYSDTNDIETINHGPQNLRFEYDDSTNHLSKVVKNGIDLNYLYDKRGNMYKHERLKNGNSVDGNILTFNAADKVVKMSNGTKYAYDARGLRIKTESSGRVYTMYDAMNKLIYRNDTKKNITSEYFYVGGNLVARRDKGSDGNPTFPLAIASVDTDNSNIAPPPPQNPPENTQPEQTQPANNQPAPKMPATLWPGGVNTGTTPQFIWSVVPEATRFSIQTRKGNTAQPVRSFSAAEAKCASGEKRCVVNRGSDSAFSGVNFWRVKSQNSGGESGWSAWREFNVGN